jgi:hypothetical protein
MSGWCEARCRAADCTMPAGQQHRQGNKASCNPHRQPGAAAVSTHLLTAALMRAPSCSAAS